MLKLFIFKQLWSYAEQMALSLRAACEVDEVLVLCCKETGLEPLEQFLDRVNRVSS